MTKAKKKTPTSEFQKIRNEIKLLRKEVEALQIEVRGAADGSVECWGDNSNGQCSVPTGLGAVTAIAAGFRHTVALMGDGTLACWGDRE